MPKPKIIDHIIKKISSKRSVSISDKTPIEVYQKYNISYDKQSAPKLRIIILNAPCNGFGDVVFGMKLSNYLKEWYNCDVKIATTKVDNFKTLGEKDENLYQLKGGKQDQCRRFRNLNFVNSKGDKIDTPTADLIFVAPLQLDFGVNYSDVKALLPYSNYLNTYFFSEYNDYLDKNFDFNTGVGKNRCGLLFTENKVYRRLDSLVNPYVLVYISQTVKGADTCFLNFYNMVADKYCEIYKKFDIVIPPWIGDEIIDNVDRLGVKTVRIGMKYYDKIVLKQKNKETILWDNKLGKNILVLRADILPVNYENMQNIIYHSEREVLVTGDQSITDVMSCCWEDKLPMYQVVPWKRNFAKEMAVHLPQKFLKYIQTTCGSLSAINYHPDFEKFMRKWDFRSVAKPKLDAIVNYTLDCKYDSLISRVNTIFLTSRTKNSLITKLEELI